MPNTVGHEFPSFFLSTRAVSNDSLWDKKKAKVKEGKTWKEDSFFQGIVHDDKDIIAKIKLSCLNAYKTQVPENSNNGNFLLTEDKWIEVWKMCGRLTTVQ